MNIYIAAVAGAFAAVLFIAFANWFASNADKDLQRSVDESIIKIIEREQLDRSGD